VVAWNMYIKSYTVDREIFALKIIRVKIFRVDKFSRFRSIREIIWTSAWRVCGFSSTTRYQENQGLFAVVTNRTFTSGSVDLRASLFTDHHRVIYFSRV